MTTAALEIWRAQWRCTCEAAGMSPDAAKMWVRDRERALIGPPEPGDMVRSMDGLFTGMVSTVSPEGRVSVSYDVGQPELVTIAYTAEVFAMLERVS